MKDLSGNQELRSLISNLYTLTGIPISAYDSEGRLVFRNTKSCRFCQCLHEDPEGAKRCRRCGLREMEKVAQSGDTRIFRCHAGVCVVVVPIFINGIVLAYLVFGQFLDKSSVDRQWQAARKNLVDCVENLDRLETYFYELPTWPEKEIHAYAEILKAVGSYIHMSGLMEQVGLSDRQRIELYIEQHYMEKISLSSMCEALDLSRTKLCMLAREISGGRPLSQLIAQRRVDSAKRLLAKTDDSISAIAEAVGIPDYNYFTKVFRTVTGMTPSAFRKQNRQNE